MRLTRHRAGTRNQSDLQSHSKRFAEPFPGTFAVQSSGFAEDRVVRRRAVFIELFAVKGTSCNWKTELRAAGRIGGEGTVLGSAAGSAATHGAKSAQPPRIEEERRSQPDRSSTSRSRTFSRIADPLCFPKQVQASRHPVSSAYLDFN